MSVDPYTGREQVRVKHTVLKEYLTGLALKLAQASRHGLTLNYVDAFSGPWEAATDDLSDTSPGIALSVLDAVQAKVRSAGRQVLTRCLFIEKQVGALAELDRVLSKYPSIMTTTIRGTFEESIQQVAAFVRVGADPFGFVFIDPTGWTGFRLRSMLPVFNERSEMLVNLMTKDIARFLDLPELGCSLRDLYDGDDWQACSALSGWDRDDCLASGYCRSVERVLHFKYVADEIVLNPTKERPHYHMIHATNNIKGLDLFRDVERRAMGVQSQVRGQARRRLQEQREPMQGLLIPASDWRSTTETELSRRFLPKAKQAVDALLVPGKTVAYDDILAAALRFPMTTRSAVNDWLREAAVGGRIRFIGLPPANRIPRPGCHHQIAVSP